MRKRKLFSLFVALIVIASIFPVDTLARNRNNFCYFGGNNSIESIDEIPDISDVTPPEDQIIIVYDEERSTIADLDLTRSAVLEAETLVPGLDVITPESDVDSDVLLKELEAQPEVAAASYNEYIKLDTLPNDPYIENGKAWQFEAVNADKVWDKATKGSEVKIAVIDSGINMTHEDLKGRCEIGYDYVQDSAYSIEDPNGHGTSVSSMAVATADNGRGLAGIAGSAPVTVVAYRAGGKTANDTSILLSFTLAAIKDVINRGDIQVINMSFGGTNNPSTRIEVLKQAQEAGIIMVAAASNDGNGSISYPASNEGVISVAAIDSDLNHAYYSNYNKYVDVAAPGSRVILADADDNDGYKTGSGTSFASPAVAGAAAFLKSVNPDISAERVEEILKETALDLGAAGRDNYYGYGLIQMDKAYELSIDEELEPLPTPTPTPTPEPETDFEVISFKADTPTPAYLGTTITLTVTVIGGSGEYSFTYTDELNGKVTTLAEKSPSNTFKWTPNTIGGHILKVVVEDSKGNSGAKWLSFSIQENPGLKITFFGPSFEEDKPPFYTGDAIILSVDHEEGSGNYNYLFIYQKDNQEINRFSWENAWDVFEPQELGNYTITVEVTDNGTGKKGTASLNYGILQNTLSINGFIQPVKSEFEVGEYIWIQPNVLSKAKNIEYCYQVSCGEEIIDPGSFTLNLTEDAKKFDKPGTYTITALVRDHAGLSASASIDIIVKNKTVAVTGVQIGQHSGTITVGETLKLTASVIPENADNQTINWSSGSDTIATVKDGIVTGISPGVTEIWAITEEGGYMVNCTIQVKDSVPVSDSNIGDINIDGKINASDALEALRHSVKEITLTGEKFTRADVTFDGTVNASDALEILRYSVKEINHFTNSKINLSESTIT